MDADISLLPQDNNEIVADMEKIDIKKHKFAPKRLAGMPKFGPMKKAKLPGYLGKMKSKRLHSTNLIDVSDNHAIVFYWRDGEVLSDTAFFAALFNKLQDGNVYPLFEFHWHPSHKGFHCKTPCGSPLDYTNRSLPKAVELGMTTKAHLDPRNASHRVELVHVVCRACNIALGPCDQDGLQGDIWN